MNSTTILKVAIVGNTLGVLFHFVLLLTGTSSWPWVTLAMLLLSAFAVAICAVVLATEPKNGSPD